MFDPMMRRLIDPPLDFVGRRLAAAGVRPNTVTWIGFGIGVGAMAAMAYQQYWLALALILANRAADGLDGAVARYGGITDLGGFLDIVLDFIFYSGVVFGFAVGRPDLALAAAFLIFSFVGTGTAFLAYAIMAAKRDISTDLRGRKSLFYVGGLTEGTETIALFVAICLLPQWFVWLAYGYGTLCWLTTGARIVAGMQSFRD